MTIKISGAYIDRLFFLERYIPIVVRWLKGGNRNMAFFQRVANMIRQANLIQSLTIIVGFQITEREQIRNHIYKHFKGVFDNSKKGRLTVIDQLWRTMWI